MGAGDVPAGQQQSVHAVGQQAAIGDFIGVVPGEFLLHAGRVQARAGQVVYVEVEPRLAHHPVLKVRAGEDVLPGQGVQALEVPGLAHAEQRGAADQEAVLIAGHVLAQEVHDRVELTAADHFALGQAERVGAVDLDAVGHVDRHHAGQHVLVQQHVTCREGQQLLGQRLQLALGGVHRGLERAGEHRAVVVHARHLEHD